MGDSLESFNSDLLFEAVPIIMKDMSAIPLAISFDFDLSDVTQPD